jgi:hypothetical protein
VLCPEMYLEQLRKNHIDISSGEPVTFQTDTPQIRGRNANFTIPSFGPEILLRAISGKRIRKQMKFFFIPFL